MNALPTIALTFAAAIAGAAVVAISKQERTMVERVQGGADSLRCDMKDGMREIEADKVVGFEDGVWLFTNGSSKSCYLVVRK